MSQVSSDNDIFSISDATLAQRYQFVREIGAGNWGCVWLCKPKMLEGSSARESSLPKRVAVKLVFREKKPTTAQRVRSLWNEMKIVRSLKHDPHPSIVPFHSFIITPSFAIITMEYLPQLVPVEVPEQKARDWFRSLLSAVVFLHNRGIVHNDIKPANILLSIKRVPVLVDFGFAERYELGSRKAFLSNLAYGTPEYLSPERARGNIHDTRKSDIWSLGITFFEILVGRTPFEYVEGETFTTPEDLEEYWSRTVEGRWIGRWSMSRSVESLIRRMVTPNADLRVTASEAMIDPYWTVTNIPVSSPSNRLSRTTEASSGKTREHGAASAARSAADVLSPRMPRKELGMTATPAKDAPRTPLARVQATDSPTGLKTPRHRQRLPTIEASPMKPATASRIAEAQSSSRGESRSARTPAMKTRQTTRKPVQQAHEKENPIKPSRTPAKEKEKPKRAKVLHDLTDQSCNVIPSLGPADEPRKMPAAAKPHEKSWDRVKAFERLKQLERARLRLDDSDEDDDSCSESPDPDRHSKHSTLPEGDRPGLCATISFELKAPFQSDAERVEPSKPAKDLMISEEGRKQYHGDTFPRVSNDASSTLKANLKASLDKTLRLYKSSTLGQSKLSQSQSGLVPPTRTSKDEEDCKGTMSSYARCDRGDNLRQPKTTLPVVRNALQVEKVAADSKLDRMTMWIRNVEQVVKEAQENFASSSTPTPLPPVPARRTTRPTGPPKNIRTNKTVRKLLPADQIFNPDTSLESTSSGAGQTSSTGDSSVLSTASTVLTVPSERPSTSGSPRQRRRATISSPSRKPDDCPAPVETGSPSKRREKAKSSGDLMSMVRPISPLSQLERELEKDMLPRATPNLSAVLDRSVFIARAGSTPQSNIPSVASVLNPSKSLDLDRTAMSQVKTHKRTRTTTLRGATSSPLLSPGHSTDAEGDYEQFLMSTTGVKRVGRGYQSDYKRPTRSPPPTAFPSSKKHSKFFGGGRRMPPPISSEDVKYFADEFGNLSADLSSQSWAHRSESSSAVQMVRSAFKAIINGKPNTKRPARVI